MQKNSFFTLKTRFLVSLSLFISFNTSFSMEMEIERTKRWRTKEEEIQEKTGKKPKTQQEEKKIVRQGLYIVNATEPNENLFLVLGNIFTEEKFSNIDNYYKINIPYGFYTFVPFDQITNQVTFSFVYHRNKKLAGSQLTFFKDILNDNNGNVSPGIISLKTSSDGMIQIDFGLLNPNPSQLVKINLNNYPELKALFGRITLENFDVLLKRYNLHGYL